jgi:hypothetical protein
MKNQNNVDKWGNPQLITSLKERNEGFLKGFVEIQGQLYKIDVSLHARKEGVAGWCTFTKLRKRQNSRF